MLAGALSSPVAATPRSVECGPPRGAWQEVDPEDVALDPAKLEEALNFARPRNSQEIAVYRNGCLVAARRWEDGTSLFEGYSMSKSVTAMAAGRAVTLGLLRVNHPVGRYVPEAEGRHARITVEHLLTQTSGLHWNFWRDYNIFMRDRVTDALSLPFAAMPPLEVANVPVVDQEWKDSLIVTLEREWCAPLRDVPHRSAVVEGSPTQVILDTARNEDAMLVVVGSRGRGGFTELLLGSVSHQLAHHVDRPLVIVPPERS